MRYTFADCVLDTELCQLYRAGEAIAIRPKVLQVLTYLIEHNDRVVSKQELFEQCWQGRVVGDATLNSCLKEARRAIGDSGEQQKFLRTLHGHGYHFVAPLDGPEPAAATEAPAARPDTAGPLSEREFKQVSVLACTIRNARELSSAIGPEEMDARAREFFASAKTFLDRYGGSITERSGDGFVALFGAPQAFEDHASRAALAALEITGAVAGGAASLNVRCGLHTGEVLVGSLDDSEGLFTATGSTTRVAGSIRDAAAAPVVASESFHRLIEADFETGSHAAADGERLFEIRRRGALRAGVPHVRHRVRSRFVGRDDEAAIIGKRLQRVMDGVGQVVCVTGEPGIGKSRLLQELLASVDRGAVRWLQAGCLAYRQSSPYFPLLQLLRQVCGLSGDDPAETVSDRLRARAEASGIRDEEGIELLLQLLDASTAESGDAAETSAAGAEKIFRNASRLVMQAAAGSPLVLAIEDLHWIDASTEQWLESLVPRLAAAPVLVLVTFRPGYHSAWLGHSSVTQLALPRLNDADSGDLIDSLATGETESGELRRRIVNHAQGNPFFLEELTFGLTGSGAVGDAVPTTVQAVLASRIDQLSPSDKSLLQACAVIGTPVPAQVLQAVSPLGVDEIAACIRRLEAAELLYELAGDNGVAYHFKHALTRDVAYQSLLSRARRACHEEIAEAYQQEFPDIAERQPELVAHHFEEAGLAAEAMRYWRKAGIRAAGRSANPEAASHFERALEVSQDLPQDRDLKERQLDIYLRLGPLLMSSKAFTSPAVEAAYMNARRLCDEVGTQSQLFTVLWGLWLHYAHRGRIDEARPMTRRILEIASGLDDPGLTLQAHHAAWTTEIWHGDLQTCSRHAHEGIRLYDRETHHSHAYLFGGHDPGVCARGTAAIVAWFLGKPDLALELTRAGAELARSLDHPYSRIITMHDYMEIEALRGNPERSAQFGRRSIEMCTEQEVPNYLAVGHIFAGWGAAATGDFDQGMAEMQAGLDAYRDLGAERNLASYLLLSTYLCRSRELCKQGLEAIDEASRLISRTGEIRWAAEILRMRGELLLSESDDNADAAESLFREALEIAASQGCKSFELRAATSLARLLSEKGDADAIQRVLRPVYEWFSEGFDTADLKTAAALLEQR